MPCSFILYPSTSTVTPDEFHGESVFVDGDFFNQPPDKRLVVFGNAGVSVECDGGILLIRVQMEECTEPNRAARFRERVGVRADRLS